MKQVIYKSTIFIIIFSFLFSITSAFASASSITSETVIEQSSMRILHSKNGDEKLPMASTTKIMTALVVLENSNPDDLVIVPKDAEGVEGSSIYLKAGETYTVRDLLYGLMLRSGNDSAVALAINTAGSIENFAKLMNKKAKELGANNTNFVNPHGLHHKDHYTTSNDLAIITANAYNNKLFRKIVGAKSYKLKNSVIYNKNKLLSSYEGADGVKTGYTTVAGRCLVSSSTRNGMQVISVVLNCYDMWERSKYLMDNAHSSFKMHKVVSQDEIVNIDVENGKVSSTKAKPKNDKYYPLKEDEQNLISKEYLLQPLVAPINSGKNCGLIKVYFDNRLIFKENIYTIESIEKKSLLDSLFN